MSWSDPIRLLLMEVEPGRGSVSGTPSSASVSGPTGLGLGPGVDDSAM